MSNLLILSVVCGILWYLLTDSPFMGASLKRRKSSGFGGVSPLERQVTFAEAGSPGLGVLIGSPRPFRKELCGKELHRLHVRRIPSLGSLVRAFLTSMMTPDHPS